MNKKIIFKYFENSKKIKINLKNGFFYQGKIIDIDGDTIIFKDKFQIEIPLDIESISFIIPLED